MRLRQAAYAYGTINNNYYHLINLPIGAYVGMYAVEDFSRGNIGFGCVQGAIACLLGLTSILFGMGKSNLTKKNKGLAENESKHPLAQSDEFIIEDKAGLEMLIERTSQIELREWGTVLKAHEDKRRAVIETIENSASIMEQGLIKRFGLSSLYIDANEISKRGYNGLHHFHPRYGSMNYAVNAIDRNKPCDWVSLLTFCVRGSPEIIGFNTRYTYIPKERSGTLESKSVLVKATPRQIMEYLA